MNRTPYTFTVIRYVHDRAAGEALNVGVLVSSPSANFVGVRLELRFERLSRTFAGFDGDAYRDTLAKLDRAVKALRPRPSELRGFTELPPSDVLLQKIWPDRDLSFTPGATLTGVTSQPLDQLLEELFGRMVTSQAPGRGESERRTDEEVWQQAYQSPLRKAKVSSYLVPKQFTAPDFEVKFDHTFQNRLCHVVQPITMDFVRKESLQDKATKWLGTGTALSGHPKIGKLYLLLGAPHHDTHHAAYVKAKNLLHKIPIDHEIFDEGQADEFAQKLASYMREHGIVRDDDVS